jgi:hypothetical protein
MGSYAQLKVADLEIAHFKSEVEPWVALVFAADDRRSRPATVDELDYYGQDAREVTELVAPADVVRDRLELTGAEWGVAVAVFDELVQEKRDGLTNLLQRFEDEEIRKEIERQIDYLSAFGLDDWVDALRDLPPDRPGTSRVELGTRSWLLDLWSDADVRLCLRAALECRPAGLVSVDVTDLIEGGWLSADDDPRDAALVAFGWAERHASPIVVLTEGSTDAQILETALDVTYPHLSGFIRFSDFSHRPESNAAALVKTVKAFAAAGITNRVVALFDADAAARNAARSLDVHKLPPSIQVRYLPPIQIAHAYPTIGPSGAVAAEDINGRACSIELYLGRDVLTDPSGSLRPVRWTAFIHGVDSWQGAIEGKSEILARFWAKAEAALKDQTAVASQDWSGLRAVIDEVRLAFTHSRGD